MGDAVGRDVGLDDVGERVGLPDKNIVGLLLGFFEGCDEGPRTGCREGVTDGQIDGRTVGCLEGVQVG